MTKFNADADLRRHVVALLEDGNAHITFADAVKDFPVERAGVRPEGSPHSAWELLEHLRLAQADILLFSRSKDYIQPKWPDDYWPSSPAPKNKTEWDTSIKSVRKDLAQFVEMLNDEKRDLFEAFPWGDGQIHIILGSLCWCAGCLSPARAKVEPGLELPCRARRGTSVGRTACHRPTCACRKTDHTANCAPVCEVS